MIRIKKQGIGVILLIVMTSMLFTGCSSEVQYEVANYQGELAEDQTKSEYDKELFYRNDKITAGADPFVLDNTERDGYYYLYVTEGSMFCYRSLDMMEWEPVGHTLDNLKYNSDGTVSDFRKATYTNIWAPEVLYDVETELYYMFFSAEPQVEEGKAEYQLMVATSKWPDRDFQLVDFTDASSCGAENVRDNHVQSYPQYFTKYALLDPAKLMEFLNGDKEYTGYGGHITVIDPHPFIDDNGDKYLYWVDLKDTDRICVMKMKNWLTPDWSTATIIMWANYYTGEDYQKSLNGENVLKVPYEMETIGINEGPFVVMHKDKYYLTFSINTYKDNSYQVIQAVADSPMGPYRKLTEEEGGVLMSGITSGSVEASGTGHHSFVTIGEQMYMVYHKHDDVDVRGYERHHSIDEIKWITIKDKDGKDLDVMYANGPTCSVQPKIEKFSEYKNIADEASVNVLQDKKVKDISCLTDGLLSIYKYGNESFMQYIKETSISETTTFTFDFDKARDVSAVMIYNSKWHNTAFTNISEVKFICEENGKEVIRYIDNVEFSSEYYQSNSLDNSLYYITPGAAAYAEFEKLHVKTVEITVEVPKGQDSVGISEIRILGK